MLIFLDTGFNFVICYELISDHSPVLYTTAVPFFVELGYSQIEQFQQGVFAGECSLFGNLAEAGIDTFHSVSGVHIPYGQRCRNQKAAQHD